ENIQNMLAAIENISSLEAIRPGTAIDYAFEPVLADENMSSPHAQPKEILTRLRFRPDNRHVVVAWRNIKGTYQARMEELNVEKRYAAVAGVIRNSLFETAQNSNVPPEIMARFANLFLFDVDFARDLFAGDQFEAVYEVFYDDQGQYAGSGDIIFAAMSWQGKKHTQSYYRYNGDKTVEVPYFDQKGESANRLLMKTPIEGARITSGFGMRIHPILGYSKHHKGVDFGASIGTPIMAAGDGTILRIGPAGTYGNFVQIQHAQGYVTSYAHLHGFKKGLKKGSKVRQGDIIGYVGSTGRSTGPHLHYEVSKNGKVKNPMTLEVAYGRTLPEELFPSFTTRKDYINSLRLRPLTVVSLTE
ncbi:MAG: M23 family metallopeptidase, partial [Pseudomonadota bacterium]